MNEYLVLLDNKYIVLNDSEAINLFYNYFVDKPHIFGHTNISKFLSRTLYKLLGYLILLPIITRILPFFLKTEVLDEQFMIKRISTKSRYSEVILVKRSEKYKIVKKYKSKQLVQKELAYANLYNNKSKSIIIPRVKKSLIMK